MKPILLTRGFVALVDDEDFEWAGQLTWYAELAGYAVYACRRAHLEVGKPKVYLHRQILAATKAQIVDHRDHNTLNCVRENLRITNKAGNSSNRPKMRKVTSSIYKGVTFDKRNSKWVAQIESSGKHRWLGSFFDEAEAAKAYDRAANDLFGEFAYLNFQKVS
jgi:hypothetical protein